MLCNEYLRSVWQIVIPRTEALVAVGVSVGEHNAKERGDSAKIYNVFSPNVIIMVLLSLIGMWS